MADDDSYEDDFAEDEHDAHDAPAPEVSGGTHGGGAAGDGGAATGDTHSSVEAGGGSVSGAVAETHGSAEATGGVVAAAERYSDAGGSSHRKGSSRSSRSASEHSDKRSDHSEAKSDPGVPSEAALEEEEEEAASYSFAEGEVDPESLELAELVRPSSGEPSLKRIWERVAQDGVELPGGRQLWDATLSGALDAARSGDWPLCVYLAARCFHDAGRGEEGAAALAVPDERCRKTVWLEVAAPIVIDVPLGSERLRVHFGRGEFDWVPTDQFKHTTIMRSGRVWVRNRGKGTLANRLCGSADRFNTGETFELAQLQWRRARLMRLVLRDEDCLELRHCLPHEQNQDTVPQFLAKKPHLTRAPSAWFRVLAYPLSGDVSKALVRPQECSWTSAQREAAAGALQWLGETLVSQCAKAGQWEVVELFLRAGVPLPDMEREFEGVCGTCDINTCTCCEVLRRQWYQDLCAATGRRPLTLLELAVEARQDPHPLESLLGALRDTGHLPDLNSKRGRRPALAVFATSRRRWDVVRTLLQVPEVSPLVLLQSPEATQLPIDLLKLAEAQAQAPPVSKSVETLAQYFERLHLGEYLGELELAPPGYTLEGSVWSRDGGARVLDCTLRLGDAKQGADAKVVFVSVSQEELDMSMERVADESCTMLPLSLHRRSVVLGNPGRRAGGSWLAVSVPEFYLESESCGGLKISVPKNHIPTPRVRRMPMADIVVTMVTPCCGDPLKDVPIHVAGRRMGVTDENGALELRLPAGTPTFTAPTRNRCGRTVTLEPGSADVTLESSGELYLYLQDMTGSEVKDGVFLCTSADLIPIDDDDKPAFPFSGTAKLPGCKTLLGGAAFAPVLALEAAEPRMRCLGQCCKVLQRIPNELQLDSADKRPFRPNEELGQWFEEFTGECIVGQLFCEALAPIRVGDLIGPRPSAMSHDTAPSPARRRMRRSATSGRAR